MGQEKPPDGEFVACPFCEGTDFRVYTKVGPIRMHDGQMLKCIECGARSGYYLKRENLRKAWNRRPNDALSGEVADVCDNIEAYRGKDGGMTGDSVQKLWDDLRALIGIHPESEGDGGLR